jgi:hypothetical protein
MYERKTARISYYFSSSEFNYKYLLIASILALDVQTNLKLKNLER